MHLKVLHGCHAAIGFKDSAHPTLNLLCGVVAEEGFLRLQPEVLCVKLGLACSILNRNVNLQTQHSPLLDSAN